MEKEYGKREDTNGCRLTLTLTLTLTLMPCENCFVDRPVQTSERVALMKARVS